MKNQQTFKEKCHTIWFLLTAWRPVTKYEFARMHIKLVNVLAGMHEEMNLLRDMDRGIVKELHDVKKESIEIPILKDEEKKRDEMFG